jgi:transposase InsO family protein
MSDDGSGRDRKSGYTRVPDVPPELLERFIEMVRVLSGDQTVTGAAKKLGLSRVQMQTVQHRFIEGAIVGMSARPSGPRPKSDREKELEDRVKRLEGELRTTQEHAAMLERFVEVAGDLIRSGPSTKHGRRSRDSQTRSATATEKKDPDPEPTRTREHLARVAADMRSGGLRVSLVSKLIGLSSSTLRRASRPRAIGAQPSRRADLAPTTVAAVAERVRETNGAIGAAALGHALGVSRRRAATIKAATTTQMERERMSRTERVEVTAPGVMRGFDAMHLGTHDGTRFLLVAADAAVPYRTSITLVERCDGASVHAAIEADLDAHGAPLVWRMDRASAHRVESVSELLASRGVLVLHGPPRHPRFYGQLERQNRDHRALLASLGERPSVAKLAAYVPELTRVVNERWPRRALGWRSPAEVWTTRPDLREDRHRLRDEVQKRAARIARVVSDEKVAERIAIEEALIERGLLRLATGAALNGLKC